MVSHYCHYFSALPGCISAMVSSRGESTKKCLQLSTWLPSAALPEVMINQETINLYLFMKEEAYSVDTLLP